MRPAAWTLAVALLGATLGLTACGDTYQTALGDLEDCVNGVDDNDDGAADCQDVQCAGHAACLTIYELACDNGVDDDGDGSVDCADTDCQQTSACDPTHEWSCADGEDNDHDGLTDCQDPDCEQACTEQCDDNVDNDDDDLVDCADPDCAGVGSCGWGPENCINGVDDNGDDLADCDDPLCAERPVCTLVENCESAADDDDDGMTNCDDPDCWDSPYCVESNCHDGVDNDNDGDMDCNDSDCFAATACQGGPACLPAQPLPCGQTVWSSTVGGLNNHTAYPCTGGPVDGPERYFQFTAPREMYLDIWLSDFAGVGLFMVASFGDPATGCDLSSICDSELLPGYMPLPIAAGDTLFLIVDGISSTGGAFDLWMDCTPTTEDGLCFDQYDNDLDFWTDCEDIDCASEPACDYWVSAGTPCYDSFDCPSIESCEDITLNNGTTVSFCTRSCSSPGTDGGECATENNGDGTCTGINSGGGPPRCLLPCETTAGCPAFTYCTDVITGSTANLDDGYCLPIQ